MQTKEIGQKDIRKPSTNMNLHTVDPEKASS
jgi:hypothetical protein